MGDKASLSYSNTVLSKHRQQTVNQKEETHPVKFYFTEQLRSFCMFWIFKYKTSEVYSFRKSLTWPQLGWAQSAPGAGGRQTCLLGSRSDPRVTKQAVATACLQWSLRAWVPGTKCGQWQSYFCLSVEEANSPTGKTVLATVTHMEDKFLRPTVLAVSKSLKSFWTFGFCYCTELSMVLKSFL